MNIRADRPTECSLARRALLLLLLALTTFHGAHGQPGAMPQFIRHSLSQREMLEYVTDAAASSPFHNNPSLFVDGAFNHRPFRDGMYGFKYITRTVEIPEDDSAPQGQLTWVDAALCCASTPRASLNPDRDRPRGDAIAPPPAERCLTYEELTQEPPLSYKDDVEPRGIPKSPCRERNPACVLVGGGVGVGDGGCFARELTAGARGGNGARRFYRDAHHMYQPRHEACCEYFDEFLRVRCRRGGAGARKLGARGS